MANRYIRLNRREALRWLASASAAAMVAPWDGLGAPRSAPIIIQPAGTLTDPDLLQSAAPWGRTLSRDELRAVVALSDLILPADYRERTSVRAPMPAVVGEWVAGRSTQVPAADSPAFRSAIGWLDAIAQERFQKNYLDLADDQKARLHDDISPSASQLKVPDFIDEWISAPYPEHAADKKTVREGLAWLNAEARRRFSRAFADLTVARQTEIGDDICHLPKAKPEFKTPAAFFARVRDLAAAGFYTTRPGMKDLRYIGNVAMQTFRGPPPEVLAHLKLG